MASVKRRKLSAESRMGEEAPLKINLCKSMFSGAGATPDPFVEHAGGLSARLFSYATGVQGVELKNSLGSVVVLPFQGQQVWDATFLGRRLTMESMFDMPRPVELSKQWAYIDTYGAFFVHCGATAMGCPGDNDKHPVHGDLPNAPYQSAYLGAGADARGQFLEIGGSYKHTVAFTENWEARPRVRLYADASTISIEMRITNHFAKAMDLMLMAHTNFVPTEGSKLVYSHKDGAADAIAISGSVNGLVPPSAEYTAFLETLKKNPARHNTFDAEMMKMIDPEILVYMRDFATDADGKAHSMQVLPGGGADYVAHYPSQLPLATRWMVKDGNQAALGLTLPATAEPTGKESETAKGNLRSLAAGETCVYNLEVGALGKEDAAKVARVVEAATK